MEQTAVRAEETRGPKGSIRKYGRGGDAFVRLQLGSTRRQTYIMVYSKHQMNCNGSGIVLRIVMVRFKNNKVTMAQIQLTLSFMGKFDSCHHNSVKLGVTSKIMPLNGMDFNMTSNFKKL